MRDLKWLAEEISTGRVQRGIPERLEALAAWCRLADAAEAMANGTLGSAEAYSHASAAVFEATVRMRAAGVAQSENEFTFSPWCGSDDVFE